MPSTDTLQFGEFRLDLTEGRLWRGDKELKLTAKAFAVLRYLVAHPQRVVNKTELFTAVWPGMVVSDWALATCVQEIRRMLGDPAKTPRMIETVHKRGYCFHPSVTTTPPVVSTDTATMQPLPLATGHWQLTTPLVGRDAELAQLANVLDKALRGARQMQGPTPHATAEACFQQAIEIARQQRAKSLELRAVMSLARLRQQQGKREEARQILAEIYGWFTEWFDTANLQEAKALLEAWA